MAFNFTGEDLTPKRGGNPLGRKLEGVRVSMLKKGQNQITLGEDVLEQLALAAIPVAAKVTVGTGKMEGKLAIVFGDGPFKLNYTSAKRKTTAHIMSSSLPITVAGKAEFKVFAEDKAVVIQLPTAAPAGDASIV